MEAVWETHRNWRKLKQTIAEIFQDSRHTISSQSEIVLSVFSRTSKQKYMVKNMARKSQDTEREEKILKSSRGLGSHFCLLDFGQGPGTGSLCWRWLGRVFSLWYHPWHCQSPKQHTIVRKVFFQNVPKMPLYVYLQMITV